MSNSRALWAAAVLLIFMAITVRLIPDETWAQFVLREYSADGEFTDEGRTSFAKILALLRHLSLLGSGGALCVALVVQIAERRARKTDVVVVSIPDRPSSASCGPVEASEWVLLGMACAARVSIASAHLSANLTYDELMSWNNYVSRTLYDILGPSLQQSVNNHVLLSLLNWATVRMLGNSEINLRLWSVASSVGTLVAVHALTRLARLSRPARLVVIGLLTVSPLVDFYSTVARGYGPSMFVATAAVVLHLRVWLSARSGWLVASGLANTLLMLCLVSNIAIIAALFVHIIILGFWPGALGEPWQRKLWGRHLAVTWGAVVLASLVQLFFLPFVLANMVIHGGQGAEFGFQEFTAALLASDVFLRGGGVWRFPASFVSALVLFSICAGLVSGLRRLREPGGFAVVAMSLTVLCALLTAYASRSPLRVMVPVHAVAVALVVWSVDAGLAGWMACRSQRLPPFVLAAPISVVALVLMLGGAWLCLKRTSPEPVFETISLAESLAGGRPIWSAGLLRNQDWNRYYASRPIDFRTNEPEEQSIFLMLKDGHAISPEDKSLIEFVRRFGHRIGHVAPGFEVWECPAQRAIRFGADGAREERTQ